MAWVRIDDCFDEHPKLQKVGPIGWGYWLAGLAYCNRNLTDGFIPWAKAQTLASFVVMEYDGKLSKLCHSSGMVGQDMDAEWVIMLLLEAGLWEEVDGGFAVHDYSEYQPTKAQIEEEREKKKAAGQAGGQASAVARASAGASANVKQVVKQNPTPNPSPSPTPIRKESDKSLSCPEFHEEFWVAYPRRQAKKDAEAAWRKLNPDRGLIDGILRDVQRRKSSQEWQKDGGKFIPLPATYLNGSRWEDEIEIDNRPPNPKPDEYEWDERNNQWRPPHMVGWVG